MGGRASSTNGEMNSGARKEGITARADPSAESTESWPIMRCCTLLRKRRDDERKSGREWERMGGKYETSQLEWDE